MLLGAREKLSYVIQFYVTFALRMQTVQKEKCTSMQIEQVAQLSQRDRAAGWVSYGQKWKTGTGRQYVVKSSQVKFNHQLCGQNGRIAM